MLMSYLGALKSWIYMAVFHFWAPSLWSVRIPMLLAAALSIVLFYSFLRRLGGTFCAVIGTILLSTDCLYVLTSTFDWGPVALQHLLFTAGILLVVMAYQRAVSGRQATAPLAAGFFAFGLALWDKAIFLWAFGGLGIASLLVLTREVRKMLTPARIIAATLALWAGAGALYYYNKKEHWPTLGENTKWDVSEVKMKANMLLLTFGSDALLDYLVREPSAVSLSPRTALQRVADFADRALDSPRFSLQYLAFLLAVLLIPFRWRTPGRRGALFALVFLIAAWVPRAVNKGTGGSVHHTILLWPMPQMLMAFVFAQPVWKLGRWPAIGLTALIALSNLAVLNFHYVRAFRDGGGPAFTDAIDPLARYLDSQKYHEILPVDWGIYEPLRVIGRGRYPLRQGNDMDPPTLKMSISDPTNLFVTRPATLEMFAGATRRLVSAAAEAGYRPETLEAVKDRNGRVEFEVFRFTESR